MSYVLKRSANVAPFNSSRVTLGALVGLAAIWTAMLLLGTGGLDQRLLLSIYAADTPLLALIAMGFTYFGSWYSVVLITIAGSIFLYFQQGIRPAVLLMAASLSARLMVILQKAYFARLRPEESLQLVEVHYQSFPSGHSANPLVAFLMLALLAAPPVKRNLAVGIAILLAALIGISRPMLGVHWPSDVVAGWAFGLAWVLLWMWLANRAVRRGT
ncbi:MAG: phosphatase PAP2 family protein [Pseudomonadota bacterium]|nr:phosphatase PAP2 family protein [Pseudomonadota bacterium]